MAVTTLVDKLRYGESRTRELEAELAEVVELTGYLARLLGLKMPDETRRPSEVLVEVIERLSLGVEDGTACEKQSLELTQD
jgi:hypothetical protein